MHGYSVWTICCASRLWWWAPRSSFYSLFQHIHWGSLRTPRSSTHWAYSCIWSVLPFEKDIDFEFLEQKKTATSFHRKNWQTAPVCYVMVKGEIVNISADRNHAVLRHHRYRRWFVNEWIFGPELRWFREHHSLKCFAYHTRDQTPPSSLLECKRKACK